MSFFVELGRSIGNLVLKFFSAIQSPSNSNEELEFLNEYSSNPSTSIPFLNFEMKISFAFNVATLFSFSLYFFPNNEACFKCDFWLSLWFCGLNGLILLMIPSKIWCIKILNFLGETQMDDDSSSYLSRAFNEFFNSRGFRITNKISKTIFFFYIYGTFRTWQTRNLICPINFLHIIRALISSVFLRLFISFVRLLISNPQSFIDLNEGVSQSDLSKLQLKVVGSTFSEGIDCSICLENMSLLQTVRIMKCPGSHAFHSHCIDKWLFKKKLCPNCNCNVFSS